MFVLDRDMVSAFTVASVVGAGVLISAVEVDVAGCLVSDGVTVEEAVVILVGTVMVASTESV